MSSTASHRQSVYMKNDMAEDDVPEDVHEAQARALFHEDNEQPVRHLFIDWPASSIKGAFTIGASVPDAVPPLFDMPLAEVTQQNAASAVFKTRSSPINVVVNVVHGQGGQHTPFAAHTPQPATPPVAKTDTLNPSTLIDSMRKNAVFISAKSVSNSVTVHVPEYFGRRPLHIRCKSTAGHVTVMLPPSFNGMISWRSETGTIQTSKDVTSHVKRLDADQNKRHGTMKFVADPDLPAWMTGNGRRGDVCELITKTGRISVYMSGEKKKANTGCVVS
ncbi:hypothetical protein MPSI1_003854 [Malassezia psittaci]|uniref:DUF7330 domain-containing protein n=1 Tax=Malassezia psittaci TaxID=1821823 RepID=A0AAF0FFQ5_9BASI|nr:hypothetical protein MPSI1_003854 [Malassezia psittaci]